jgi:hypothetical protein
VASIPGFYFQNSAPGSPAQGPRTYLPAPVADCGSRSSLTANRRCSPFTGRTLQRCTAASLPVVTPCAGAAPVGRCLPPLSRPLAAVSSNLLPSRRLSWSRFSIVNSCPRKVASPHYHGVGCTATFFMAFSHPLTVNRRGGIATTVISIILGQPGGTHDGFPQIATGPIASSRISLLPLKLCVFCVQYFYLSQQSHAGMMFTKI